MPRLGTVPRRHALGEGNTGGTRGMGELATGSLPSSTGNRMSRACGWHMSTPMPREA